MTVGPTAIASSSSELTVTSEMAVSTTSTMDMFAASDVE